MKVYKDENVMTAFTKRINFTFDNFDNYYISFSAGKDSSVMLQMTALAARDKGVKFDVLFIDLEAQYSATISHVEEIKETYSDVIGDFYWVCLPLSLRNASSVIQPKWVAWGLEDKQKWVRDMPKCAINQSNNPFDWFVPEMEFEEFIKLFAKWYEREKGGKVAALIGIRTDESLNRFRTIVSQRKQTFGGKSWTTKITSCNNVYNVYPIYDWHVSDIWGAVSKFDLLSNEIYELMYKNGLSIHQQRLCQPYGDDQRDGIDQFRYLEPETWEKVLNRVHGVNFANVYARTSLLGNITTEKPKDMTWEQYSVFLLETLGMYAPELRDHYVAKITKFISWHKENENLEIIPDEEDKKLEAAKKKASWRRIARALEKNDFWLTRLSYGQTKKDVERLMQLREKYANIIRPQDANQKHLKEIAIKMEEKESEK